jgi:hypothetical protein
MDSVRYSVMPLHSERTAFLMNEEMSLQPTVFSNPMIVWYVCWSTRLLMTLPYFCLCDLIVFIRVRKY